MTVSNDELGVKAVVSFMQNFKPAFGKREWGQLLKAKVREASLMAEIRLDMVLHLFNDILTTPLVTSCQMVG
jgi:hypothetical protein